MDTLRSHFDATIAALVLCLGVLYTNGLGGHGMFMWDEAHYAVLGRALADGGGYVEPDGRPESLRPPLLPTAVASILWILPNASDRSVRSITVIAAVLCVLAVYLFVKREIGAIAAAISAVALGTAPEFWRLTSYLLTEIPFMLFHTLAVVFFCRGLFVDSRGFLLAWPCWALALSTRYTAVLFGPICVLLVIFAVASRDRSTLARMQSRHFLVGPMLAALIVVPWLLRAWVHFGDPLTGFQAAARQLPNYSRHAQFPLTHYLSLLPRILGWLPFLLLCTALPPIFQKRNFLALSCMIAATVIVAWMSQYGWKEPRLISAAVPLLAIVIGTGTQLWLEILRLAGEASADQRQRIALAVLALGFLAAIRLDPSYAAAQRTIAYSVTLGYPSFRNAMDKLDRTTDAATVLTGPNCYQITWYAKRRCLPLPGDESELPSVLANVDYVIATSFERGQASYVNRNVERLESIAPDSIETFADRRYFTKIIAADTFAAAAAP